jgi:hypothetical protein
MNGKIYVIKSESEMGFWNKSHGWVSRISAATKYTKSELPRYMPMSENGDSEFVVYEFDDK